MWREYMQRHIDEKIYHVELLTPKQASETLEEDLEKFAMKYEIFTEDDIHPLVGSITPASIFTKVVFPVAFAPTTPMLSPM